MGEGGAELQPATLSNMPSLKELDARERPNSESDCGVRPKAVENFWSLERVLNREDARCRLIPAKSQCETTAKPSCGARRLQVWYIAESRAGCGFQRC